MVGEKDKKSALNEQLKKLAREGKSPKKISEILGEDIITPAQVAERVTKALEEDDWLTVTQRQALLLDDLYRLKDILFEAVEDDAKGNAGNLNRTLMIIADRLTDLKRQNDSDMNKILEFHAAQLVHGLNVLSENMLRLASERYPEIDAGEWEAIVQDSVEAGAAVIEAKVQA